MNFKSVKTAAELPIKGIEIVKEDGKIVKVIVGGKVHITQDGTYSPNLKVTIPQPYEEVKRYRVVAKPEAFPAVTDYYESEWDAKDKGIYYAEAGATVTQDVVTALINDAGDIVGVVGESPASVPAADDLIPF